MNPQKPGWMTSEFWLSLATQVVAVLVLTGVIKPGDQQTILGATANIVTGVFAIVSSTITLLTYIQGRNALKVSVNKSNMDAVFPSLTPNPTVVNLPHVTGS